MSDPRILPLALALAGCSPAFDPPAPAGCVTDVSPGVHALDCAGLSYAISVPALCESQACGLIVDVHGLTMNGEMEDHNTNLRALGMAHGYIVAQPSASGGSWNPDPDDRKVFGFMQQLITAFHVDERRVHFTGFSQGGFMSWRFICAHSDVLASVAPAAAGDDATMASCDFATASVRELPILFMHGTLDALVPFGEAMRQRDAVRVKFGLDAEELVEQSDAHRRRRYTNTRGTVLEFIEHDYTTDASYGVAPVIVSLKGHCFPGSGDVEPSVPGQLMPFACKMPGPSAFTWGEAVMDFFLAHPREER